VIDIESEARRYADRSLTFNPNEAVEYAIGQYLVQTGIIEFMQRTLEKVSYQESLTGSSWSLIMQEVHKFVFE
jgi:hypothetical protein